MKLFALFFWPYAIGLLAGLALVYLLRTHALLEPFWGLVDPGFGIFTAIVATLILFKGWRRARQDAMPRRLTVTYTFNDEILYVERQAYLAHEGDARQLAQQIVAQICNSRVEFDATKISEIGRGPEPDLREPGGGLVYALNVELPLKSDEHASLLRAYAAGGHPAVAALRRPHDQRRREEQARREEARDARVARAAAVAVIEALEDAGSSAVERLGRAIAAEVGPALITARAEHQAPVTTSIEDGGHVSLHLFVCAGEASPPDERFEVLHAPAIMDPQSVRVTAEAVRARLAGERHAEVLVKGPIALGIALGHLLEHVPCRVDFLQLDQATKRVTVWWSNTMVAPANSVEAAAS